jgi:hypothetical protein
MKKLRPRAKRFSVVLLLNWFSIRTGRHGGEKPVVLTSINGGNCQASENRRDFA